MGDYLFLVVVLYVKEEENRAKFGLSLISGLKFSRGD